MKPCVQCGTQNADNAAVCAKCGQTLAGPASASPPPLPPGIARVRYQFATLKPEDKDTDLVTLLTCATLPEADVILSHLEGAGISACTPDEYRMAMGPWELDQLYKFRVQVAPADFEAAKEVLTEEIGDVIVPDAGGAETV